MVGDLSHFRFSLLRLPGVNTEVFVRRWVDGDVTNKFGCPRGKRGL